MASILLHLRDHPEHALGPNVVGLNDPRYFHALEHQEEEFEHAVDDLSRVGAPPISSVD